MTRIRLQRVEAIVLKRRDHGEADRVLTLYSAHRGKFSLVARGIRRPTSRWAGHLEPFTLASVLVATGRTFDVVTQAQTIDAFPGLRGDLERWGLACHAAELVDRTAPDEEPNPPIFQQLRALLARISAFPDPRLAVRTFELRLLDLLGYRPELMLCVNCGTTLEPAGNRYSPDLGGVVCGRCPTAGARKLGEGAFRALRFVQANDWSRIAALELSPATHAELQTILVSSLRHVLERDLKSLRFLDELNGGGTVVGKAAPLAPRRVSASSSLQPPA